MADPPPPHDAQATLQTLTGQVNTLVAANQNLQQSVVDLQQQVGNANNREAQLTAQIAVLQQQVTDANQQLQAANTNNAQLTTSNNQLTADVAQLTADKANLNHQVFPVTGAFQTVANTNNNNLARLQQATSEVNRTQGVDQRVRTMLTACINKARTRRHNNTQAGVNPNVQPNRLYYVLWAAEEWSTHFRFMRLQPLIQNRDEVLANFFYFYNKTLDADLTLIEQNWIRNRDTNTIQTMLNLAGNPP